MYILICCARYRLLSYRKLLYVHVCRAPEADVVVDIDIACMYTYTPIVHVCRSNFTQCSAVLHQS